MKNIQNYNAAKYIKTGFSSLFQKSDYKKINDGIYEYKKRNETLYVTSLSFVQEPEF